MTMGIHSEPEPFLIAVWREIVTRAKQHTAKHNTGGYPEMKVDPGTWDLFADITRINAWLDRSNFRMNSDLDSSMRIMKIGEEYGETVAAYIGMTGQNPRKRVTHSQSDVLAELSDVVVTALCAIQHFTQDGDVTRAVLASKVASIMDRANLTTTENGAA